MGQRERVEVEFEVERSGNKEVMQRPALEEQSAVLLRYLFLLLMYFWN